MAAVTTTADAVDVLADQELVTVVEKILDAERRFQEARAVQDPYGVDYVRGAKMHGADRDRDEGVEELNRLLSTRVTELVRAERAG
jgi:hypothetical protein